jgi:membrane-associated phospholipid phosphatase
VPIATRARTIWFIVLLAVLLFAGIVACVPRVLGSLLQPFPALPAVATEAPQMPDARSFELFPANVTLFRAVNSHRAPWLDWLTAVATRLEFAWIMLLALPLTGLFRPGKVKPLLWALLVESILVFGVKAIFNEPRPPSLLAHVYLLQPFFHGSFPSGDTALAAMMAVVLAGGERWWTRAIWGVFVVLVALERLYVGVHFPLDVLTGATIGAVSGWLILRRPAARMETHA